MTPKRKAARSRTRKKQQSNRDRSASSKPRPGEAKPWHKQASTWLTLTVATAAVSGIIGNATGVIGTKLGNAVTDQGQPSGPPVLVSQVSFGPGYDGGRSHALPEIHHLTATQLAGLSLSPSAFNKFIEKNHGAAADGAGRALVQLTLRGNRSYPVLITGMKILKQCGPPMRGTLFYSPPAGEVSNAMIGFDLDSPTPQADTVTITGSDGKLGSSYFLSRHITLNGVQDTQVASIEATTAGSCSFRLVLQVLDKSQTINETVNDSTAIGAGPPFRITRMITRPSLEPPELGDPNFTAYGLTYVGGVMDASCRGYWTRVDSFPSTTQQYQSILCGRT